jgi:GTP-binding protein HflX
MKPPRVILIDIIPPSLDLYEAEKSREEIENLVETYRGVIRVTTIQKKQIPDAKTYIGSGKLQEVIDLALQEKADILIFNNTLKPSQLFHIEWMIEKHGIKVWDRIDLILKIFEKHAVTAESKLQIELAALKHMGPRIFGMGLELSRQGGGIGTRGKGETNTEIMKRHIKKQIQKIEEKIEKIQKGQQLKHERRKRNNLKTVSLIGYTNAGKSQLLFSFTQKKVIIRDELFATLDARSGELFLPKKQTTCILSDTIGFIKNLPPSLIHAFTSTLSEAIFSDILLHIVDFSDPQAEEKIQVTEEVLHTLGIHTKKRILVFNKTDLPSPHTKKKFLHTYKHLSPVFVSALKKEGFPKLLETIEKNLKFF